MAVEGEALAAQVKTYLGFYEPRATRLTRLFPHTADVVKALSKTYRLAVCTNKPTAVSREIVDSLGIGAEIAVVVGGDSGVTPKPAPDMMWLVAERLGLPKEDVLMVGRQRQRCRLGQGGGHQGGCGALWLYRHSGRRARRRFCDGRFPGASGSPGETPLAARA